MTDQAAAAARHPAGQDPVGRPGLDYAALFEQRREFFVSIVQLPSR